MKTTSGVNIFGFQEKPFDIFVISLATISNYVNLLSDKFISCLTAGETSLAEIN